MRVTFVPCDLFSTSEARHRFWCAVRASSAILSGDRLSANGGDLIATAGTKDVRFYPRRGSCKPASTHLALEVNAPPVLSLIHTTKYSTGTTFSLLERCTAFRCHTEGRCAAHDEPVVRLDEQQRQVLLEGAVPVGSVEVVRLGGHLEGDVHADAVGGL